jgi:hypothetical protein
MPSLVVLGALACTYAVITPDGRVLKLFYVLIALGFSLALSPQSFIAGSILAFAVSTAFAATVLPVSPVPVYFSDLIVLLVALRGVLPRDRVPPNRMLSGWPTILFAVWALVMTIAAVRAMQSGVRFASAVRGDIALVYWPLLYFGFSRVLRERRLNRQLLWRNCAAVALGLAGWMFVARALNHPFHDPGLALVSTGETTSVSRNFGFAGAFIVYPVLALVGLAGMAHGGSRRTHWAVLASVGVIATLFTLVRGEIFGLALAAVVLFWLRSTDTAGGTRARTAVQVGFAVAAVLIGLVSLNPTLGNAVVQRAIPFTHQAPGATANAQYREKAVSTGFRVARAHPAGLGVLDVDRLEAEGIDPGYLAHSGVATLLLFGGWPALLSGICALLSVCWRSYRLPAPTPWLHPALVAVLTMLAVYSISAAGIAGDPWVIPLGALAVAIRFNLPSVHATDREHRDVPRIRARSAQPV